MCVAVESYCILLYNKEPSCTLCLNPLALITTTIVSNLSYQHVQSHLWGMIYITCFSITICKCVVINKANTASAWVKNTFINRRFKAMSVYLRIR